jgi:hypothetical protein
MSNFLALQAFYRKHEHLTIPNKTLSQWLTYQRLHAKTLNERQLTLLESIKYKDANLAGVNERDEEVWRTKYEELEKFASETGDIKSLSAHLRSWVYRQKCKFKKHTLDPNKQQLLEAIEVELSGYKERSSGGFKDEKQQQILVSNFHKTSGYRKVHGHCNVPYRFANDPSLGEWVSNQRKCYKRVKEKGKETEDSWIKLLEDIGFEWTRKPEQSKLRNRSWSRIKNKLEKQLNDSNYTPLFETLLI